MIFTCNLFSPLFPNSFEIPLFFGETSTLGIVFVGVAIHIVNISKHLSSQQVAKFEI